MDRAEMPITNRGDPIKIVRVASAMVRAIIWVLLSRTLCLISEYLKPCLFPCSWTLGMMKAFWWGTGVVTTPMEWHPLPGPAARTSCSPTTAARCLSATLSAGCTLLFSTPVRALLDLSSSKMTLHFKLFIYLFIRTLWGKTNLLRKVQHKIYIYNTIMATTQWLLWLEKEKGKPFGSLHLWPHKKCS